MDANELKEAMATASKVFADGLAANEKAKRDRDQARAVAELRSDALRRTKDALAWERKRIRNRAIGAVAGYCSKARAEVLVALQSDKRMPRSINYLERYNALLGMDDRSEVLRRLDQTIAKAESVLDEVDQIDVDAALSEAASKFAASVRKLDGITILAAEDQVADETAAPPEILNSQKAESDEAFEQSIEGAFLEAFGTLSEDEEQQAGLVADQDARIEALAQQIEKAMQAAGKAGHASMRNSAHSVAGNKLMLSEMPAFDGSAVLEAKLDVDQVRELAAEVRKSFKTFKEVVRDNGLFAAFASEGTFGACKGWRFGFWWDDFLSDMSQYEGSIPGRSEMRDIPCDIEEDEGGDSLEKSIERMQRFNKKRYFGLLDDDFDGHVEAFWYGFKKLMESVNGLFRMNPSAFNQYCNDLAEDAKQATLKMGASSMDTHQVDEFCETVAELGKG